MASMKELLRQDLERAIAQHGPDSRSARDLRTQLTSLEKIRTPSELGVLNSSSNERYHGATVASLPSAVPTDLQNLPVDPASAVMTQLEEELSPESTTEKPPTSRG